MSVLPRKVPRLSVAGESALGQSCRGTIKVAMFALLPKTDSRPQLQNVCFGPKAEISIG